MASRRLRAVLSHLAGGGVSNPMADAAAAPAMCCLAAGTSRDQSALAEVRSMVARTKVADCGQTGAQGYAAIFLGGDFFHRLAPQNVVDLMTV